MPCQEVMRSMFILIISISLLLLCIINVRAEISVYAVSTHQEVDGGYREVTSKFGPPLPLDGFKGMVVRSEPTFGCGPIKPPPNDTNPTGRWIALIKRGNCTFESKVRFAQKSRYDLVIIYNFDSRIEPMFANNTTGIHIPSIMVSDETGRRLDTYYSYYNSCYVVIDEDSEIPFDVNADILIPFAVVVGISFITMISFMICKYIRDRRRARRHRLPASSLRKIPIEKYLKGSPFEMCAICLDDYVDGERLRVLPCNHAYHSKCVDPWLTRSRRVCPICKRKVYAAGETPIEDSNSDSDSDHDEQAPLIRPDGTERVPPPPSYPLSRTDPAARDRLMAHLYMLRSRARRNMRHTSNGSSSSSGSEASSMATRSNNSASSVWTISNVVNSLPSFSNADRFANVIRSINSIDNSYVVDVHAPSTSGHALPTTPRNDTNASGTSAEILPDGNGIAASGESQVVSNLPTIVVEMEVAPPQVAPPQVAPPQVESDDCQVV